MKLSEFTIEKAFFWAPGMLVSDDKTPGLRGKSWYTIVPLKPEDALTKSYYYEAPEEAMLDYLLHKQLEIDSPFNVIMMVKTKNGKNHIYTDTIGEINFATKDIDDIRDSLVIPTALKLVRKAANDLKFKDVLSVTACVEEL